MTGYFGIGIALAFIGLTAACALLSSRLHYTMKMALAVWIVVLSITIWSSADAIFGYPINCVPNNGTAIYIFLLDKPHNAIYLWLGGHKEPFACSIPYDQDLVDKLIEASKRAKNSGGVMRWNSEGGTNLGVHSGRNSNIPGVHIDVVPAIPEKA